MKFVLLLATIAILATVVVSTEVKEVKKDHHVNLKKAHGEDKHIADKKKLHIRRSFKKASEHDFEHGKKGKSGSELHKKADSIKGGKKSHAVHSGKYADAHDKNVGSAHKANFKNADHKKTLSSMKGYHEKYHKDEHKKMDEFYTNHHKAGSYVKFGESASKKAHHNHKKDAKAHHKAYKHADKHAKELKHGSGKKSSSGKAYKNQHDKKASHTKTKKYDVKKHH